MESLCGTHCYIYHENKIFFCKEEFRISVLCLMRSWIGEIDNKIDNHVCYSRPPYGTG